MIPVNFPSLLSVPATNAGHLARLFLLFSILLSVSVTSVAEPKTTQADELTLVRIGFPHDSLFDLAFDDQYGIAVGDHGVLLESHDGGRTWAADESLDVAGALMAVVMHEERVVAVGQEGIVLTRQGNQPWESQESGTAERLFNVAMADDGMTIAVGGFGTLLRSSDFGRTWEQLWPSWEEYLEDPGYEPHLYDVAIMPDGRILLAGEFGLILLSRDGGETWEQRNASDESIFGMAILESGAGLAVGQNGYMIRTSDGGENWTQVDIPSDGNLLAAWLSENGEAVVVGIRAMLTSGDGGQTWASSASSHVARNWYTALAASHGDTGNEDDSKNIRVFTAGMLGMIMEINLGHSGGSGGQNP